MIVKAFDDMVSSARRYVEHGDSTFVSDTEVAEYVNRGIEHYWDLLLDAGGATHYSDEATLSVVSGTDTYELPADFYSLIEAHKAVSGTYYRLNQLDLQDRFFIKGATQDDHSTHYRITGHDPSGGSNRMRMKLYPTPSSAFTVEFTYISTPFQGTHGNSDNFFALPVATELAELFAARKIAVKGEDDTSQLDADILRCEQRLLKVREDIDRHRPMRISDTRRDNKRFNRYGRF